MIRVAADGNVVLDKGSDDRLAPDVRLKFHGYDARLELVVLSTSETESVAKPQFYWNSGPRVVQVGDPFTTGGCDHRPRGTGFERLDAPPPTDGLCVDACEVPADDQ